MTRLKKEQEEIGKRAAVSKPKAASEKKNKSLCLWGEKDKQATEKKGQRGGEKKSMKMTKI